MQASSTAKEGNPAVERFFLWSRFLGPATQEVLASFLAILLWLIGFFGFTAFPLTASAYLRFNKYNLLKLSPVDQCQYRLYCLLFLSLPRTCVCN